MKRNIAGLGTLTAVALLSACGDSLEDRISVASEHEERTSSSGRVTCPTDGFEIAMGSIDDVVSDIECEDNNGCHSASRKLRYYVGTESSWFLDAGPGEGDADETTRCSLIRSYLSKQGLTYHGPQGFETVTQGSGLKPGDRLRYGFGIMIELGGDVLGESLEAPNLSSFQGRPLSVNRAELLTYLGKWDSSEGMIFLGIRGVPVEIECEAPFFLETQHEVLRSAVDGRTPNPALCRPFADKYACRVLAPAAPRQQKCTVSASDIEFVGSQGLVRFDLTGSLERSFGGDEKSDGYALRNVSIAVFEAEER